MGPRTAHVSLTFGVHTVFLQVLAFRAFAPLELCFIQVSLFLIVDNSRMLFGNTYLTGERHSKISLLTFVTGTLLLYHL